MSKIIMYILSGEDFDPLQKEYFVYGNVEDAKEAAEEYANREEGWLDYQAKAADITIEELVAEDVPEGFQIWQCSPFYDEKIPDRVEWYGEEIKVQHTGTAKTKIFGESIKGKTVYDYSKYDCAIESGFIEHDRGNKETKAKNEKKMRRYQFSVFTAKDFAELEKEIMQCEVDKEEGITIDSLFIEQYGVTEKEFIEKIDSGKLTIFKDCLETFEIDGKHGLINYCL